MKGLERLARLAMNPPPVGSMNRAAFVGTLSVFSVSLW